MAGLLDQIDVDDVVADSVNRAQIADID